MLARKESLSLLCTLACAFLSARAQAEGAAAYELASYSNGPGGKELAIGDYAATIARTSVAAGPDLLTRMIAATNMCVAQTATRAFAAARTSCDRAVELARQVDGPMQRGIRQRTSATARALSNRGVLRALSGDPTSAARDLRAAAPGSGSWQGAAQNLARLQSSPSYRVALAGGTAD
jgi:hypothetical protein